MGASKRYHYQDSSHELPENFQNIVLNTRLSEISLNNNPKPWEQVSDTIIKIAAMNFRKIFKIL